MKECEVCGRNRRQLEGQLGIDPELEKDQGILKCSKCQREYDIGLGRIDNTVEETNKGVNSDMDWKDQITA